MAKPTFACHVDKNLLKELEIYIKNKIAKQTGASKKIINEKYSISINDKSGLEEMKSISDYSFSLFSDNTRNIEINVHLVFKNNFYLLISFGNEYIKNYSNIKISYESNNPKPIVLDIYEGINKIIESHRNYNEKFHPNLLIETFIETFTFVFLVFAIYFYQVSHIFSLVAFLIFLGMAIYQFIGNKLNKYITFETSYHNRLRGSFRWFAKYIFWFIGIILSIIITINFNKLSAWFKSWFK